MRKFRDVLSMTLLFLAGAILFGTAIVVGGVIWYLLAWLAVVVFAGFGVQIPFWPTFGAIILVIVALGLIGRR